MSAISRGQVWWADLGEPAAGSAGPAVRRPVLVVQSDAFNASVIRTVVAVAITSSLALAKAPGNVLLPARASRLDRDSVADVSQVVTLDRARLTDLVSILPARVMAQVDAGLRLVLDV